jgi:hypothetical protein
MGRRRRPVLGVIEGEMMMNHRSTAPLFLLSLLVLPLLGGANCQDRAFCEKVAECADDPPGEDYVDICTTQRGTEIAALAANDEEECQVLASAVAALNACRAQLDCDDFREADYGGQCDDELDDYQDALDDAADDRYGGNSIGAGGPGANYNTIVPLDCSSFD